MAVRGEIVGSGEARHHRAAVRSRDISRCMAAHALVAHAKIEGHTGPGAPVIVHVGGGRRHIDGGAAKRHPRLQSRRARYEAWNQASVRVELRTSVRPELVVRLEHIAAQALRVAAHAGRREVLKPSLELVRAGAARRHHLRHARGELAVVPLFGVGRVEIGTVVLQIRRHAGDAARQKWRVPDRGARAAGIFKPPGLV